MQYYSDQSGTNNIVYVCVGRMSVLTLSLPVHLAFLGDTSIYDQILPGPRLLCGHSCAFPEPSSLRWVACCSALEGLR